MQMEDAERDLAEVELVSCLQAGLADAKELRDACLEAEIPVLLDRDACCGKGGCGCGPKVQLLAREQDVPRIAQLMKDRWRALALREGTIDEDHPVVATSKPGEHACPACGTSAPLAEGACSDCGLQLE